MNELRKFPKFKREVIVLLEDHSDTSITEPLVIVGRVGVRPLQRLSEAEFDSVPAQFRCYCCHRRRPRRHIGGIEVEQYLCKFCYPYVGEGWVRRLIMADLHRGFRVELGKKGA